MSITTLAALTSQISAQFTFLVEIYPSEHITDWTEQEDTVFYNAIGEGIDVQTVFVDGVRYVNRTSLALCIANPSSNYYDGSKLYVHVAGGAGTTLSTNTVVANYKVYYSNDAKTFNDHFYQPALQSVPNIRQTKQDIFWGVSIISSGSIVLANGDGEFDNIFQSWAWENKQLNILFGGEDLPYTEYVSVFDGIITQKEFTLKTMSLTFQDKKEQLTSSLDFDTFATADYSDLNAEDVGKPIPHVWGKVKKMPAVCTNRDESPTPVNYTFKIADTTTHDIENVTAAYVNEISKTVVSVTVGDGTFTIAATDYTAGDPVTADVSGFIDASSVLIENPIDILEELLELEGFSDSDWDTDAKTLAITKAESYPCGLVMNEYEPIMNAIGDLMKSCLGTFYLDNDGDFAVKVFTPIAEADLDIVSDLDIKDGSFKAVALTSKIRQIFRCGYVKKWVADTYAYETTSSTDTERIYDITKSRTVGTLLSTEGGAKVWLDRLKMLYESGIAEISYVTNLQFASKNMGDQMILSFRRRREDADIAWLSERRVDLLSILKNFKTNEMSFIVNDLKGIGAGVGFWTDDDLSFPTLLGGAAVTAYDKDWTEAQKNYAFETWGFWTDTDGLIDDEDATSLNRSRWW